MNYVIFVKISTRHSFIIKEIHFYGGFFNSALCTVSLLHDFINNFIVFKNGPTKLFSTLNVMLFLLSLLHNNL